jgi:uncharacterized protein YjiS (DUF1127 family)
MKASLASQNVGSTRVLDCTTEMSLVCSAPEHQPLVRRWHIGATPTAIREITAQWWRRVLTRNKLTTVSDSDLRDIRRTRAKVEAERCRAFWRA